jgi:uncharacterized protein Yka (UPF0111/DUF47 family)
MEKCLSVGTVIAMQFQSMISFILIEKFIGDIGDIFDSLRRAGKRIHILFFPGVIRKKPV